MKILITGVGGPTPRSFAKSLKRFGNHFKDIQIIGTDANPLAIGLYQKELFASSHLVPLATQENYWSEIERIVQTEKIDFAIILPEVEVVEWSKKQVSGKLPCPSFLPHFKLNDLLVNKAKMTDVLEDLDVVPPSIAFNAGEANLNEVFDKLGNDFWVRSSSGTSGLGSLRVDSLTSLKNWIEINPGVTEFLASTFLPGRNLACKLLYWEGKLVRSACAERVNYIMSKVAPSGITGNTSFGRLLNEPKLVEVAIQAMEKIFEHTQTEKHGFFTVDFKEDGQGKPYITEINVRHVAFTQCFAAGGANFAEDTVRLMTNDSTFDFNYKMYTFQEGLIFLRDVDENPILMFENELLK